MLLPKSAGIAIAGRCYPVTVDADITMQILRNIQEDIGTLRTEMRAGFDDLRAEMRAEIQDVRSEIGAVNLRMTTVEKTLVTVVQEQRMLTQYVKGLTRRIEKLEAD